ncbi:hypothetical protein AMK59_8738 [Oryctes borbonicus]|uniref:Uncharacterized protein n=1 Tax=Oryctes borbonicus TaxID=1629725 RepID=A0A0T6ATC8_9SCAR|nr:hypothetical protein AMK59_8738 [Oryctes borbonicus]
MELTDKCTAASDDEDDLEKLRLAALQTIKRNIHEESNFVANNTNKPPHNPHKRRNFQGRNPRNGQFFARQKNTNLISIPTVSDEPGNGDTQTCNKSKFSNATIPKLVLPQDRYCNSKSIDDKPLESSSKFDRYDNSDESETEWEYNEESNSESESPGKLEKTTSLEALMQELENEIQGDSKPKEEKIIKPVKMKKRKQKAVISESLKENDTKETIPVIKNEEISNKTTTEKENVKDIEIEKEKFNSKRNISKTNLNIDGKKPPLNKRFHKKYYPDRNIQSANTFLPHQPYAASAVYSEDLHYNHNLGFNRIVPYNTNINVLPSILPINSSVNYLPLANKSVFDRPPSPLSINTDDALTITRAPLSPRSAAFVLQNREIIERRKKSPRRSYSRSPSPRYRRSKSPVIYGRSNRSASPRKFVKSKSRSPQPIVMEGIRKLSPCKEKVDPIRDRRSPISERRSPLLDRRSPVQRSISPLRDRRSPLRNKISPLRQKFADKRSPNPSRTTPNSPRSPKAVHRNSPKSTIHERLGAKSNKKNINVEVTQVQKTRKRSRSLSREKSEPKEKPPKLYKEEALDPILEARRKKFETNVIKNVEGIIRLKPKTESTPENNISKELLENNEGIAQEDEVVDFLDAKVDDLFSDEDTDEENEGRFKSTLSKPKRNVSVLPFTQLLDNSTKNIKSEVLKSTNQTSRGSDKDSNTERSRKRQRSRSPAKNKDTRNYKERTKIDDPKIASSRKASAKDKLYTRNKILFRNGSSSRKEKVPMTTPRENKKIEIKIRNPSKYETTSKYDVANELETMERMEKSVRKVEVSDIKKESDEEDCDSETINDNEKEEEDDGEASLNQKCEAGDLRAQLSRKRAERQSKLPVPEDVQSRLLQNALQGAVFKKPKKSRKERESAPKDGKLPIHFRLGYANNMDLFEETNVKRKRSKSKGRIDQV